MNLRGKWVIDPVWRVVSSFLAVMFFIFFVDAVLADFVPGFMQNILGSPLLMGIVMSASSIAGLTLDLLFARLLQRTQVERMILFALLGAGAFGLTLLVSTVFPQAWILVIAMVIWGLYYEFFGFASQKFVVSVAAPERRTAVWSVLETIRAIAYALGPIAMIWFSGYGNRVVIISALAISSLGFLIFYLVPLTNRQERLIAHQQISVWHEIMHWRALAVHIWPMVVLGILLGIVDAMFWTTGTIVNDTLALQNPAGGFFLTTYMLSSIVVGFVFGNKMLKRGKKKLAELFTLFSGVALVAITLFSSVWWILFVVLVSSLLNALAWPLIDAVYTDLLARMGREHIHMVGLKNASYSFAYIIGPILAGVLATFAGELPSFRYLGWLLVGVSLVLMLTTPVKLLLPQREIRHWE